MSERLSSPPHDHRPSLDLRYKRLRANPSCSRPHSHWFPAFLSDFAPYFHPLDNDDQLNSVAKSAAPVCPRIQSFRLSFSPARVPGRDSVFKLPSLVEVLTRGRVIWKVWLLLVTLLFLQ
jgi:hypothetical protein